MPVKKFIWARSLLLLDCWFGNDYHVLVKLLRLTRYGLPQVAVFPCLVFLAMVLFALMSKGSVPLWILMAVEGLLFVVLVWVFSFFRDPHRQIPSDTDLLLSPADGKVVDIQTVNDDILGGRAKRIGIFLSVFNVHINRAPCNAKIEKISYKKGKYKDARNPLAGQVNESNTLVMTRVDAPAETIVVRQISGAIARRIVCEASEGGKLAGGEKFGMIKFGSRTELYLLERDDVEILVNVGDKVKAGATAVVRYKRCQD